MIENRAVFFINFTLKSSGKGDFLKNSYKKFLKELKWLKNRKNEVETDSKKNNFLSE